MGMPSKQGLGLGSPPELRPRTLVARHAVGCFFGLTYIFSWTIWLSEPVLEGYDPVGSQWYGMLAPYGPALAAIVLAALLGWERVARAPLVQRAVPAAIVLGLALWSNWGQLVAVEVSPHPPLALALWLALTLLPAWIVFLSGSRVRGVRELLGSLTRWRNHYNHYLLAVLLVPVAGLAGIILLRALGAPWPRFPRDEPPLTLAQDLVFVFVSTMLYGGGLAEEPGWRGFALLRLQERTDPLAASVVLSIAWSVWHLPLHFLAAGTSALPLLQTVVVGLALRLLSVLPLMIIATWLYNRSRGSLLLLVMLHASANNAVGWWLPITDGLFLGLYALVPLVVIMDRMWRRR